MMNGSRAVAALAALGQRHRFAIFRMLVRAGQKGLSPGKIARATRLAPNALSFHLRRLREVGLVDFHREGHFINYTARLEAVESLAGYISHLSRASRWSRSA
jgi:ArsR family transcriptional regulator, arsenate/arsenite/antimonite-responsive transcriptional repressor